MKALRFVGGVLGVEKLDVPRFSDECLVRVTKSGICSTDLELIRGYANFSGTLGHEFVGMVEQAPEKSELVGRRVVGEINVGCGKCPVCDTGGARHCSKRTVLGIKGRGGSHAEFLNLPSRNLFPVPSNVSDQQAVFVEPLAAALGITERIPIAAESKVAVIGDGKLGILCARIAALRSADVTLIGKHREKLALVESGGMNGVLSHESEQFFGEFDVVIEASGSQSGFATATDVVRPRGTIVLKSTFRGTTEWDTSKIVVDEITVVGSRCGRFQPALDLLQAGSVVVTDLISEEFSLSDGVRAMGRAGQARVMKVLLNAGY